jgi:8-oxo-dGTP pyrophosphatase MutT (NUDIX family)
MTFHLSFQEESGDAVINLNEEDVDCQQLIAFIEENLLSFVERDASSIWIEITLQHFYLVPELVKNGFQIHRIISNNSLFLNRLIKKNKLHIAPGPYGYIGLAGYCQNEDGKILCVRENYKTSPGPWEFPGGLFDCDKDEKLSDAAVRECFEETGIKSKFETILLERFLKKSTVFGYPDIYIICKLQPLSTEIHFDPIEIFDCQWLSIEELQSGSHPFTRQYLHNIEANIENGLNEIHVSGDGFFYLKNKH